MALAVTAYNLKRAMNVLGGKKVMELMALSVRFHTVCTGPFFLSVGQCI